MNNSPTRPLKQETRRRKTALTISLTTGVVFLIVTVILGPIAYRQDGFNGLWGVFITGGVALMSFIGALQVSRRRIEAGILTIIISILILACALPFLAKGQGLGLSIIVLLIVASISSATLSPSLTRRVIISAFIVAVFIVLSDLYLPDNGLPTDPIYTNIVAVITILIYAFFILRNFRSYTLRTKIVIASILITIIPLTILSLINNRLFTQALDAQSSSQLTSLANVTANTIDDFIEVQLASVHADAKQLSLIEYLDISVYEDEEKNANLTLLALTRKNPVFIHSAAILSSSGINVLDTLDEYKDRDESYLPYFSRPVKTGLPYVSNIVSRDGRNFIHFSAPIKDQDGKIIGVLRIEYYATVLQSLLLSLDPGTPGTIISLVDANTYMRVGYTGNRDSLFKSYKNFTDQELLALQSDGRVSAGPRENVIMEPDDKVVDGIDNLQQQPFFYSSSLSLGSQSETINTGVFLKTQPWIALIQQSTETYLEPVSTQNKTNNLISLLLVVFSVGAGVIAAQILTSPLMALTKVAEQITLGDLNAQAAVTAEDEIGTLAATFNRMTSQLSQTLSGLEQRVAERTTDLELSRQQSVKRANELQSIGEISKIITGEQKLENLLPLITRLVSESFGFYHTGIFLVDVVNQYAVLQAANSSGGINMLKRGHKLEIGGNSIVGYVTKYGVPRISLDVGQDAVYFDNPDLPRTRSEMTLPLKIRDRIVGALDVQSDKPGAFTENDANTLSILADQVAISIENAQLFARTQQALSEAQALYRQNLQEGWQTFSRANEFVGYRQGLTSGKKLTKAFESDEIRQATNRGEALIFHADGVTEEAAMVVPIKLRGQVIGSINIKAPVKNRQWSSDESNLAEIISERLSIALENARLIHESKRQLIKEQQISEITGKVGTSIELKNVLQTAVEELGRALPGSDVVIRFTTEEGKE